MPREKVPKAAGGAKAPKALRKPPATVSKPRKRRDAAPIAPDMFSAGSASPESSSARATAMFITNQFNLVSILGAGYLKPRNGFSKYYEDLLRLVPGTIPLFTDAVPMNVVGEVTKEQFSIPVVLELDAPGLVDGPSNGTASSVVASCEAIPVSSLRRIYFRDLKERDEVLARKYEGVDFSSLDIAIDSKPFSGPEMPAEEISRLLSLRNCKELPAEIFRVADRLAGAAALALSLASGHGISAEDVAKLTGAQRKGSTAATSTSSCLRWIDWPSGKVTGDADLDAALFGAALHVFRASDRFVSWDPLNALRQVHDAFTKLRPDAPKAVVDMLRRIWTALKMEINYPHFDGFDGARAGNALLWALSQPQATSFDDSTRKTIGDDVRLMAAMLAGTINGFEILPTSVKTAEIYGVAGRLQAAFVNSEGHAIAAGLEIKSEADSWELRDSTNLRIKGTPPLEVPPSEQLGTMSKILTECREKGWADCLKTVIRVPPNSEITISPGGVVSISGEVSVETVVDMGRYDALKRRE
jgi:hypothetical protein